MATKPTYEELEQRVKELEKDHREVNKQDITLEVLKALPGTLNVIDTGYNIVMLGGEIARTLESIDRVIGEKCYKVFQEMDNPCPWCKMDNVLKTGEIINETTTPDDHREKLIKKPLNVYLRPLKDKGGNIIGAIELGTDITQIRKAEEKQKRAEEALRESEERLRIAGKAAYDLIYEWNVSNDELEWFGDIDGLLGYEPGAISRDIVAWFDLIHPEDRGQLENAVGLHRTATEPIRYEYRIKHRDGTYRFLQDHGLPMLDKQGRPYKWIGVCADITDRKKAEEALRESEERFRTVADFTYDWEYWIAPDGQYIYVSPSCERTTGYSPEEFMNDPRLFEKIVHSGDHSMVVNHIHEEQNPEELLHIDFRIITRSGEERWINHNCQAVYGADGTYLGRRGGNRDITKRKQMEEELLKAKKLESLGVLAGGIAHDFNNLMTSVVGNISLAKMEMKPGSEAFRSLVEAEKASIQTKELTSRLITFSEGGGPIKETVSICNLVKDSVDSSLKDSDIDARFSIPDDISPVEVDEDQMKQVIRNIITNAQEAMAGQGTINVSCENAGIGVKDTLTLKDGKYVKISIKDQGPGISEKDLIRIFDPYFSTKDMGTQKGMGLGLSISDSIVKQHDGLITVKSELGTGTILSIYLPASEKEIVEAAPIKKPVPEQPVTHGENILVMDDEEVVRNVTAALLRYVGYEVELAVDGAEAIKMYKEAMASEKPYDAVILDLTNKFGMGGVEAIKRLLEIDPDVKAIVATGYSSDPIISRFREHGFRGSLSKPFTMDELKTALREVIARE